MATLNPQRRWHREKLEDVLAEIHELSLPQMAKDAVNEQLFSIHHRSRDRILIRKSRGEAL